MGYKKKEDGKKWSLKTLILSCLESCLTPQNTFLQCTSSQFYRAKISACSYHRRFATRFFGRCWPRSQRSSAHVGGRVEAAATRAARVPPSPRAHHHHCTPPFRHAHRAAQGASGHGVHVGATTRGPGGDARRLLDGAGESRVEQSRSTRRAPAAAHPAAATRRVLSHFDWFD